MEEEQRDGEAPVPGTAAVDGQSSGHGEKETGVLSCQGFLMSMCQRDDSDDLALQPLESEGIAVLFTEREGEQGEGYLGQLFSGRTVCNRDTGDN